MSFYDLSKAQREELVFTIQQHILTEIQKGSHKKTLSYFSDDDTYIRKTAYNAIGKIYTRHKPLHTHILNLLHNLFPVRGSECIGQ